MNFNQSMINQLLRQKDNIDNLITQYSQPQVPVQNIINTNNDVLFEAKVLEGDEDISNIFVSRKTMFLDKKNKKVIIKDVDGKISEEYEIVIPLDEKDKRIIELEDRLKNMEVKINEYAKPSRANDEEQKSNGDVSGNVKPAAKTISK